MPELIDTLRAVIARRLPAGAPLCVAWSGGRDSTVLLHAAIAVAGERPLRALHVNHGLQPDAEAWVRHCQAVGRALDVPLVVRRVEIEAGDAAGPEAAAREARYRAFAAALRPGEALLTAHHLDDQFETVLLRLLRGAGPAGLAGIRELASFGPGWLLRPWLACPRSLLVDYAERAGLCWIDDPSNADAALDRNYLRHEVLPLLSARWPSAARTAGRAAQLCAEAARLLDTLADRELAELSDADSLSLAGLRTLDDARQRLVLRRFLQRHGIRPPGATRLRSGLQQFLSARADAAPLLAWPGAQLRRYRERLYLLPGDPEQRPRNVSWDGRGTLVLGGLAGRVRLEADAAGGIDPRWLRDGLTVRFRRGGERIRPEAARQHRRLKTLLQEAGVLPWMRQQLPLLYAGDRLLAVADLWLAADCLAPVGRPGLRLRWQPGATVRAAD